MLTPEIKIHHRSVSPVMQIAETQENVSPISLFEEAEEAKICPQVQHRTERGRFKPGVPDRQSSTLTTRPPRIRCQ